MTSYSGDQVAQRAGVDAEFVGRLLDLGILAPGEADRFSGGDVRRVLMAKSLEDGGIPLDGVAAALKDGTVSFDFLDAAAYERFSSTAPETFRQVSERTGIPTDLLTAIREASGSTPPSPDDRLRRVMFHFRDPGPGVRAALEMVDALAGAGLPPAHVGLHAGPVLFQSGDYFGQTVNLAARIADYARPGEVLVSRQAADAAQDAGVGFHQIGPVELKGVSGTVELLSAHLS